MRLRRGGGEERENKADLSCIKSQIQNQSYTNKTKLAITKGQ